MAQVMSSIEEVRAPAAQQAQPQPPSRDSEVAPLDEHSRARRFERLFAAHLDAAYDFARWLARDDRNAEDVVQEACLRAFKSIDGFRGENGRAWLLAIVRNTYYTWFKKNQPDSLGVPYDEETLPADDAALGDADGAGSIEQTLHRRDAHRLVNDALARLPDEFREVVVLRELEDLSYKEIAAVAGIPIGTVMSRLARARKLLAEHLRNADAEA
jgi:RNA polymerase sigma-70 factor (ECF subfamily)